MIPKTGKISGKEYIKSYLEPKNEIKTLNRIFDRIRPACTDLLYTAFVTLHQSSLYNQQSMNYIHEICYHN